MPDRRAGWGYWECEDCGWEWPLTRAPYPRDECDNCGGLLVVVEQSPSAVSGEVQAAVDGPIGPDRDSR